jgi:hypothetical protein
LVLVVLVELISMLPQKVEEVLILFLQQLLLLVVAVVFLVQVILVVLTEMVVLAAVEPVHLVLEQVQQIKGETAGTVVGQTLVLLQQVVVVLAV